MVFYILNFLLAVFLIVATSIASGIEGKINKDEPNPFMANIMILAVAVALFFIFSLTSGKITGGLFTLLMKMVFLVEMCFLINIVFCFTYYSWGYATSFTYLFKMALYALAAYFVFFRIKAVTVTLKEGLQISSDYIFSDYQTNKVIPYTWVDFYNFIFKALLPLSGCLMMLLRNETHANKLERYRGWIYCVGLILSWGVSLAINALSTIAPCYSLLYYFSYTPLVAIFCHASWVMSSPSKKNLVMFTIKSYFLYVIPSILLGILFALIYKLYFDVGTVAATLAAILVVGLALLFSSLYKPIKNSKLFHNDDYGRAFEEDLANIDYSGEMDDIAGEMYQIFKRNVEAASMHVYINAGNNSFQNAYTSDEKKTNIDKFEPLFESVLNIGRNIVARSELDSVHILSPFKDDLENFFKATGSEVLFILNEGRDVHGIIHIGRKAGIDSYSEKELETFNKLYSYLFVFGYYMRNISNKEVIGTVNRELRMSAQIITSIQENIDIPKHPKIDTGCVMIPAHNIGGEFVDMIRLTDTRHLFVMGSLSGKGIAASMSMVILKAIIRAYLTETHDFKTLVVKVNQFIRYNLQKGSIFTGMFAILDFETDTFYYINCGIPVILLYTEAYNNVIEIEGSGHVLGFVHDIGPYIEVKQNKLHKNDVILASTAGLIESRSLRGEQFGKERIQHNMVANRMYPAQRMTYFEHDELMRFMSHEMENDVTILVLKYFEGEK